MTILVCFFVLIVSFSIQDQVRMEVVAGSMRDAFGVAEERRYAGDVRLEGVPEVRQPGSVKPTPQPSGIGVTETLSAVPSAGSNGVRAAIDPAEGARRQYQSFVERFEKAILTNPLLKDNSDAITINLTPDGLQVMLIDTAGRPMFANGSAEPTDDAKLLLREAATALKPLANRIYIEGHADATGAGSYSTFDLTANRANEARRVMESAGFPAGRIAGVAGRGDADLLFPENPFAPGNRRIEIILEEAAPLLPDNRSL